MAQVNIVKMNASELLSIAERQFALLKGNVQFLDLRERLTLSQNIKGNVINDDEINKVCLTDSSIALERDSLLRSIEQWVNNVLFNSIENCHKLTSSLPKVEDPASINFSQLNVYLRKKEELLDIIHDAIESSVFVKEDCEVLDKMRQRLESDAFFLAIQGHFQHGKSTLFNSLFEGRYINPIGTGIKTSAGVVIGYPINRDEEEYANVILFSNEQLSEMFYPLLEDFSAEELDKMGITSKTSINFNNEQHIELLRSALIERWKIAKALIAGANRDANDAELRILDIRLNFFTNPYIQYLYKSINGRIPLNKVKKLTKFPKEWELLWAEALQPEIGGRLLSTSMDVHNMTFAFVDKIIVHGHSKTLKELGAVIIDCPGYGDSSWDDHIADSVLLNSDAALAIIKSDQSLDKDNADLLNSIRLLDSIKGRLFILRNTSNSNPTRTHKVFVEHDLAFLKSKGFQDANYYTVNLQQFYFAKIGLAYLDGLLNKDEIEAFINRFSIDISTDDLEGSFGAEFYKADIETNPVTFESVWVDNVNKYIETKPGMDSTTIPLVLDESWALRLLKTSGMQAVLEVIKNFLIEKKGKTLLYDNGICDVFRIVNCKLQEYNKTINDMCLARDEFEAELSSIRRDTTDYIKESKIKVEDSLKVKELAEMVSRDFCEKEIFADHKIEYVSMKIAEEIFDNIWTAVELGLHKTWSQIKGALSRHQMLHQTEGANKSFEIIERACSKIINEYFERLFRVWDISMSNGDHYFFKNEVINKFESTITELNKDWEEKQSQNDSLNPFRPEFKLLLGEANHNIDTVALNSVNGSVIFSSLISFLIKHLINLLCIVIGPVEYIIDKVAKLFGGSFNITGGIIKTTHDKVVGNISKKVREALKSNFCDLKIRAQIISEVAKIPESLISGQKRSIVESLDKMSNKAEESILKRRESSAGSWIERLNRTIDTIEDLENHLIPLYQKCNSFTSHED